MFQATLESINHVHLSELKVELLVVDNGQSCPVDEITNSFSKRARFKVIYLREPRKGKSRAFNHAFRLSRGRVLASTDDDVRFDADWLIKLVAPVLTGKYTAVSGWVEMARHLRREWLTPKDYNFFACSHAAQQPHFPGLVGANMAMAREAMERISGFDEELGPGALGFGEETLFQYQLEDMGLSVGPAYDAVLEHHFDPARLEFSAMLSAAHTYGRVNGYMAYHWHGDRCFAPRFRCTWKQYKMRCRLEGKNSVISQGIDHLALRLSQGCGRMDQYFAESRRPRRYKPAQWSRWT